MKFIVYSLGCKVNACEAESISEALIERGWSRTDDVLRADAAVVWTCAVTNTAEAKSRKVLHKIKRENPEAVTVMVGCYVQVDDGLDADILIGTAHKSEIPVYLEQYMRDHQPLRVIGDLAHAGFEDMPITHFENHSRGVLKIQDGCNQFCSYCIIPYARGRERSLDPDTVVSEAQRISHVHSEIVLTGIHTGRYGSEYHITLAQMMKRILMEVPDLSRLRISSIEVTEVSEELIELMKKEPRIARHLHIPLQSGCDAVLHNMGRPYDTAAYYDKIEWIRKELPDAAVSCDVIVGFPKESDSDFEETYAFLQKCRFSFLHVFPYSARSGTKAAEMSGQISAQIKKGRVEKCTALSQKLAEQYQKSRIGEPAEVITEQPVNGDTPGHTSDYIPVLIKGHSYTRGSLIKTVLSEYKDGQMYAQEESV